jgi:hypothetical protein
MWRHYTGVAAVRRGLLLSDDRTLSGVTHVYRGVEATGASVGAGVGATAKVCRHRASSGVRHPSLGLDTSESGSASSALRFRTT